MKTLNHSKGVKQRMEIIIFPEFKVMQKITEVYLNNLITYSDNNFTAY